MLDLEKKIEILFLLLIIIIATFVLDRLIYSLNGSQFNTIAPCHSVKSHAFCCLTINGFKNKVHCFGLFYLRSNA